MTALLRHLQQRRRRRALRRVARMLVELDALATPQRGRTAGGRRVTFAGR